MKLITWYILNLIMHLTEPMSLSAKISLLRDLVAIAEKFGVVIEEKLAKHLAELEMYVYAIENELDIYTNEVEAGNLAAPPDSLLKNYRDVASKVADIQAEIIAQISRVLEDITPTEIITPYHRRW